MARQLIPGPTSADCMRIIPGREKKREYPAHLFPSLYFPSSDFGRSIRRSRGCFALSGVIAASLRHRDADCYIPHVQLDASFTAPSLIDHKGGEKNLERKMKDLAGGGGVTTGCPWMTLLVV